jgi:phosphate starvation-inducible PhoH-like protein
MANKKSKLSGEDCKIPQNVTKIEFKPRPYEFTDRQRAFLDVALSPTTRIMLVKGPAGTSKTLMAVYAALRKMEKEPLTEMLYIRTAAQSGDVTLGFLPGDLHEKFSPYTGPLCDKLDELIPIQTVNALLKPGDDQRIKDAPVNYLRGANWRDKVIVADEAQNFTRKELYTLTTRMSNNSVVFLCGDTLQSDINDKSGFNEVYRLLDNAESKSHGIQCFEFYKKDIVRDKIVHYLVEKFEELK